VIPAPPPRGIHRDRVEARFPAAIMQTEHFQALLTECHKLLGDRKANTVTCELSNAREHDLADGMVTLVLTQPKAS
jgi:hypothetical protein